jgi:hypothetical protein
MLGSSGKEAGVRFQKALFPHGLSYGKDQKFGAAANAYPVRVLREFDAEKCELAPHSVCGSNSLLVWLKRVHVFEQGLRVA